MNNETMTIKTTKGMLHYHRNWECEGCIEMDNPQTIARYRELCDRHPNADECGVFFAFSDKQFEEGYARLVELRHINQGDKVCRTSTIFGTKEGIRKFYQFYEENMDVIKNECDPQEVYFYEFNNFESMISWDGDKEAIKRIINIWGEEVANTIKRHNGCYTIEAIVAED